MLVRLFTRNADCTAITSRHGTTNDHHSSCVCTPVWSEVIGARKVLPTKQMMQKKAAKANWPSTKGIVNGLWAVMALLIEAKMSRTGHIIAAQSTMYRYKRKST